MAPRASVRPPLDTFLGPESAWNALTVLYPSAYNVGSGAYADDGATGKRFSRMAGIS